VKFSGTAIVKNKTIYSANIFSLDIICPEISAKAKPGQFVQMRIPGCQEALWPRPFSIHHVDGDVVAIYIKKIGKITGLLNNLVNGDELQLTGPLGNGFDLPSKDRHAFLVAGGIGLPPLYFLCTQMIAAGHAPSMIHFYSGAKTQNDLFSRDEIKNLGVDCIVTTEDGTFGQKGLITTPFAINLKNVAKPIIFACGPTAMLKEIARITDGLECYLSLEQLMPCGWGVCNGCAVRVKAADNEKTEDNRPYRLARVCKEGPVFGASEILWE
jgi:dihydroorotate dehydrogenase electron transfer subunit